MNIFVLDLNPKICASYHCDKHVIKMICESAQMLSTVCRLSGNDFGYKICYQNHPCVQWTRKSLSNWKWLRDLTIFLNYEYKIRYNHINNHKSFDVILSLPEPNILDIGLTEFVQAMPQQYKTNNPIISYRSYYIHEKKKIATWRNKIPEWWKI